MFYYSLDIVGGIQGEDMNVRDLGSLYPTLVSINVLEPYENVNMEQKLIVVDKPRPLLSRKQRKFMHIKATLL